MATKTAPVGIPGSKCEKGNPVGKCPATALIVTVNYKPYPKTAPAYPVNGATVKLAGPTARNGVTDKSGQVVFNSISPGSYTIAVSYDQKNALVEEALKHVGSTLWDYYRARDPYGKDENKCNLFVYEMANNAGFHVPKQHRFSVRHLQPVWHPPLAGEWADDSNPVGEWTPVPESAVEPGDIAAVKVREYSDASGHVGIVSYPRPATEPCSVIVGEQNSKEILLERRSISVADKIVNNDYFWSDRCPHTPHFKHYTP